MAQLYTKPSQWWGNKAEIRGSSELSADDQSVVRELLYSLRCCGKRPCGKGDVTDRLFETGRRSLSRDINVVRLIRSMRLLE